MTKFLIVKTSAIGDVIHTFPVLEYLRAHVPDCQIDWLVEKSCFDLVAAHPLVNRAICIDTQAWRKGLLKGSTWASIRACCKELRKEHYDALCDLQGNTKSALFTILARAKKKVGYGWGSAPEKLNLLATRQRFEVPLDVNVRQRYLELVKAFLQKPLPVYFEPLELSLKGEERLRLERLFSGLARKALMVCFGAKWSNKRLKEETLEAFLKRIDHAFYPYFFFIWGSEEERKVAEHLETLFSGSSQAVGNLSLSLWQAMMQRSDGVIAMDSAALHLCGTTSTPSFSIFGPSSSHVYKPMGKQHAAYQGVCPYGREFVARCPILRSCSTGACLRELSDADLFDSFSEWFSMNIFFGVR